MQNITQVNNGAVASRRWWGVAGWVERVLSDPWLYDQIQRRCGLDETRRRLEPHLADSAGRRVLDVGAGTGNYTALLPRDASYFWLDRDPLKLRRFRAKHPTAKALLSDATHLALASKSVDCTICVALSHHIPDAGLPRLLAEVARVTRTTLIFVDAVERKRSLAAAVLWKLDRGSHPRPAATLLSAISESFAVDHVERYGSQHHYILCVAHPSS